MHRALEGNVFFLTVGGVFYLFSLLRLLVSQSLFKHNALLVWQLRPGSPPLTVPLYKTMPPRYLHYIHSIHENERPLKLVPQAKSGDQSTIAVWTLLA
jgi:hypothetical protein